MENTCLRHKEKLNLFEACKAILQTRVNNAEEAMKAAQEAANGEEKSSAGDKYETSRAMGHRDRDMYARQMVEAGMELTKVARINLETSKFVKTGSLVCTKSAIYFILTGIGKIKHEQKDVMVLSPLSPLALLIIGKKAGDTFVFNQINHEILNIV